MLASIKRVLILLFIITAGIVTGLILYSRLHVYRNGAGETGNTAGNIYNGGLFCEKDNKIYFSNNNDGGSLYSMNSDGTQVKKLSEDKAVYINVDHNNIYYSKACDTKQNTDFFTMLNNTGVYRIDHFGSQLKAFTGDPGAYLTLVGNYLYFQSYNVDDGTCLLRYHIDATKDRLLVKDSVIPIGVWNNSLYYTGNPKDNSINMVDLSSFTSRTFVKGTYAYPIFNGNYIYYIDTSKRDRIYRMNRDGSNPKLLVDKKCSTYNITASGKYLYYQVDEAKRKMICRLDLSSMKSIIIKKGRYKQINVTKYYIFFNDYNNKNMYQLNASANGKVRIFKAK